MVAKWTRVKDQLPEVQETVLGYDVFYDTIRLCIWDGDSTDDDGKPWLQDTAGGDDYSIQYWMPLPNPPNVKDDQ